MFLINLHQIILKLLKLLNDVHDALAGRVDLALLRFSFLRRPLNLYPRLLQFLVLLLDFLGEGGDELPDMIHHFLLTYLLIVERGQLHDHVVGD